MNLRETIRSGYKIFSRMAVEKRNAHILAVQYIETLANQTGTRMEPWDILLVFGTGKGNELVTDKTEINKRFFAKIEEIKTKTPAAAYALEERVATTIDNLTRELVNSQVTAATRSRDTKIRGAIDYAARSNALLIEARAEENRIMLMQGRVSTVSSQITEILQENFWEFNALLDNKLVLHTKNDIILTYKNAAAGIDLRVNMGTYGVQIRLADMDLDVLPLIDNHTVRRYYHPHVSYDGNVCWGNAADAAANLQVRAEVNQLLRLLASNLTQYNNDNPFVALHDFDAEAKRKEKDRAALDSLAPPPGETGETGEIRGERMIGFFPPDPGRLVSSFRNPINIETAMPVTFASYRGTIRTIGEVANTTTHSMDNYEGAPDDCRCAYCLQRLEEVKYRLDPDGSFRGCGCRSCLESRQLHCVGGYSAYDSSCTCCYCGLTARRMARSHPDFSPTVMLVRPPNMTIGGLTNIDLSIQVNPVPAMSEEEALELLQNPRPAPRAETAIETVDRVLREHYNGPVQASLPAGRPIRRGVAAGEADTWDAEVADINRAIAASTQLAAENLMGISRAPTATQIGESSEGTNDLPPPF